MILKKGRKEGSRGEEKQIKQTTMDRFLKRMTPPQEEPPAGLSGNGPKEGIAIPGGDSSMLWDLPMGQDM